MHLTRSLIAAMVLSACCSCGIAKGNRTNQQPAVEPTEVLNAEYKVLVLAGQPMPEDGPTMMFDRNRKHVSGTTGCNRYSARFDADEDCALQISQASTTRMACPDMSTENAFVKVLGEVAAYHMDGKHVCLKDAAGKTIIVLQRK